VLTLVSRSLGRVWRMWAASASLLVGFQVALTITAVTLHESGSFEQLFQAVPAFVRQWIGASLSSFAGMSALTFFEPVVILLLVLFAVYVASEPAGDVEEGLVDLVLARPLPRHWLVTRSLLAMTTTTAALVLALVAANVLSVLALAPGGATGPAGTTVLDLSVHLFALTWCFGGLTLAVAASLGRRSSVLGVLTVAVIALFLMKVLAEFTTRFDWLRWATPFDYFRGTDVLMGTAPTVWNVTVLLMLGATGAAIGYWRFQRRDL
jgi:ABC-2 type transport system permease protein